jgi:DNA topoisomerase-2
MAKTTDISGNAASVSGLEKLLKLYTTHAITNMHLFDADEHLRKFESPSEIIEEYYGIRLEFYNKRRTYQIDSLNKELVILSNKARFINDNLDSTIDLRRKKREEIIQLLTDKQYSMDSDTNSYNYLIKMPMDSVTEEAVNKLINEKHELEAELNILETTTIQTMWITELEALKKEYIKFTTVIAETGKKIIIKKKKKS